MERYKITIKRYHGDEGDVFDIAKNAYKNHFSFLTDNIKNTPSLTFLLPSRDLLIAPIHLEPSQSLRYIQCFWMTLSIAILGDTTTLTSELGTKISHEDTA